VKCPKCQKLTDEPFDLYFLGSCNFRINGLRSDNTKLIINEKVEKGKCARQIISKRGSTTNWKSLSVEVFIPPVLCQEASIESVYPSLELRQASEYFETPTPMATPTAIPTAPPEEIDTNNDKLILDPISQAVVNFAWRVDDVFGFRSALVGFFAGKKVNQVK
jgi:hypothetical protein